METFHRYVFSLWDIDKQGMDFFLEEANSFHPTIKFTAEISDKEITFLDAVVCKGERFQKDAILDIKTFFHKLTETFHYTLYTSCHPPGVKRSFIKGEAIRPLRTNSSKKNFQESLSNFKTRLLARGYPKNAVERILSEISFTGRQSAWKQKKKTHEQILRFVTTYHPGVKNLKIYILIYKCSLIQNQPLLRTIFKEPPII